MSWWLLSKSYRVVSSRVNSFLPQAFMDGMHGHQSSLSCETWVLDTLLCAQSLLALHVGSCPYGSPSYPGIATWPLTRMSIFLWIHYFSDIYFERPRVMHGIPFLLGLGAQRYALFRRCRHQNGTRVPHNVFARGKAKHYLNAIAITRSRVLADD